MGDHLEARLNVIENIQEEFGHDIWEVKEHLARLTSLFKDYIRTKQCILEDHHQINKSHDLSSGQQAISHVELIAPTCGNQYPQLRPPLGRFLDM